MKTIIRLALLVALLCAFQPGQASAQTSEGVNPHPQTLGVFFHFFWGANHPLSNPTGQGGFIAFFTAEGGVFALPVGASRSEVNEMMGGPFYVSILIKYGIIAFDANGNLIPGPNAIELSPEEARELQQQAEPAGEGG